MVKWIDRARAEGDLGPSRSPAAVHTVERGALAHQKAHPAIQQCEPGKEEGTVLRSVMGGCMGCAPVSCLMCRCSTVPQFFRVSCGCEALGAHELHALPSGGIALSIHSVCCPAFCMIVGQFCWAQFWSVKFEEHAQPLRVQELALRG